MCRKCACRCRCRPAARPPAPAPGRSGGRGWASGRARRSAQPGARAPRGSPAAGAPAASRASTRSGSSLQVFRQIERPARGSRACTGWRARSVGWRSETIRMSRPRCSSAGDLLGDEGLRQARIALQDEGDRGTDSSAAMRRCTARRCALGAPALDARLRSGGASQLRASRLTLSMPVEQARARPRRTGACCCGSCAQRRRHRARVAAAVVGQHRDQPELRRARGRGCTARAAAVRGTISAALVEATGSRRTCCSRPSRRRRRRAPSGSRAARRR